MNQLFKLAIVVIVIISYLPFALSEGLSIKKGETVKQAPLLETPSNSGEQVKLLAPKQALNVYERQRAWYRVTTSDMIEGWVKMLNLRMLGRVKREGELGVVSLLDSMSPMRSTPTTSTGIRGFDEEDLMNAKANLEQVGQLENYTISESELKRFIANGRLNVRKVADVFEEQADE